jgi:hypothetical protein
VPEAEFFPLSIVRNRLEGRPRESYWPANLKLFMSSPEEAGNELNSQMNKMADAYNVLRAEVNKLAGKICPRK